MPLTVTAMEPRHWPQVEAILRAGIETGHATFESVAPTWERFDVSHLPAHRFVAVDRAADGVVVGWAAVSAVSAREVYAGVVEHSVYVADSARGRGVGRTLLEQLVASTEAAGIWTIQSSVFPENGASLALHRALGFREVGRRHRIARMSHGELAGRWRDTVLLERRSAVVGTSDDPPLTDGAGGASRATLGR